MHRALLDVLWLLLLFQDIIVCTLCAIAVLVVCINEEVFTLDVLIDDVDTPICTFAIFPVSINKWYQPTLYFINTDSKYQFAPVELFGQSVA
jgi:hypothetical protein